MIALVIKIAVLFASLAHCSDVSSEAATTSWIRLRQDPRYIGFKQFALQKTAGHLGITGQGLLAKIIDGTIAASDSMSVHYAPFRNTARYIVGGPGRDDDIDMIYDSSKETIKVSGEMGDVVFTINYSLNDPTKSTFLVTSEEEIDRFVGSDNVVLRGRDLPQQDDEEEDEEDDDD